MCLGTDCIGGGDFVPIRYTCCAGNHGNVKACMWEHKANTIRADVSVNRYLKGWSKATANISSPIAAMVSCS